MMNTDTSTRNHSPAAAWQDAHHHRQFEVMGAHAIDRGTHFALWAPNARQVAVIGTFNGWHPQPLHRIDDGSGRWMGFFENARCGDYYKFRIQGVHGDWFDKADPYAFRAEHPPGTASQI